MTLHLPKPSVKSVASPYERYGLRDLPFPNEPVVNPYSNDPRVNGAIYAKAGASTTIKKFEDLLIRPNDFPNRARLAYLWAKGDSESGRGVGKTALLRYFRHRINQDWGHTEFHGAFSAVVIYISFRDQVSKRHIEQLAASGLVDICKSSVLDSSRAALRMEALGAAAAERVMATPAGPDPKRLLDAAAYAECGIDLGGVDASVHRRLVEHEVDPNVAGPLARGQFPEYLRSMRKDGSLEPLYRPHDTKLLDVSRKLLFDDIVNYLRAAHFAGGYLFIDDIENLTDQMTRKDRIEFAKEFGICAVRPGYANTKHKFFSCVLTTHQQSSVSLAQAWGEAGLSSIAQLDPGSPNSVELPFPSKDQAKQILLEHLDHYRVDPAKKGRFDPFTQAALDALLAGSESVHPRTLLTKASQTLQHACSQGLDQIDAATVNAVVSMKSGTAAPDLTDGLADAL